MYIFKDRELLKTVFYLKTGDRGLKQMDKFLSVFNEENNFSILVKTQHLLFCVKVQMKCFFLLPNLKEQQKSGRSFLNISSSSRVITV